jgi:acetyl esterase
MPLHPQASLAIAKAGELALGLTVPELRAAYTRERLKLQPLAPRVASAYELSIPSEFGSIPARFYRATKAARACPLVVFFHGGGWVVGSLEGYDTPCRRLAVKADCAVMSIGYRLAPETQFPGAIQDAYAATSWCWRNAARLGIDPARIAVCGDSAGGNLAAVVAQMSRDSREFDLARQLLVYPATDISREWPSYERNASGYMLTADALRWFIDKYVPDPEDRKDPRVSPMRHSDHANLPPALIISAEFDPLVDENEAYADRLSSAGVPTKYVCFAGMIHPFFTLGGLIEDAEKAEDLIANEVRAIA